LKHNKIEGISHEYYYAKPGPHGWGFKSTKEVRRAYEVAIEEVRPVVDALFYSGQIDDLLFSQILKHLTWKRLAEKRGFEYGFIEGIRGPVSLWAKEKKQK
jgi:hypothetical protein